MPASHIDPAARTQGAATPEGGVALRFYETTVVFGPGSDEAATLHEIDKITQTITGSSGTLVATQRWGMKRMAYPIQKHAQGNYVHFVYQSPPAVPARLESMFRINENVLRHLTVLVEGPLASRRYGESQGTEVTRDDAPAPAPEPAPAKAPESVVEASPAGDAGADE
jgi:small subunit ribosomal protein S6